MFMRLSHINNLFGRNEATITSLFGTSRVQSTNQNVPRNLQNKLLPILTPARVLQSIPQRLRLQTKSLPQLRLCISALTCLPLQTRSTILFTQNCTSCHNEYEQAYHPLLYKTQKCHNYYCEGGLLCPFLHGHEADMLSKYQYFRFQL